MWVYLGSILTHCLLVLVGRQRGRTLARQSGPLSVRFLFISVIFNRQNIEIDLFSCNFNTKEIMRKWQAIKGVPLRTLRARAPRSMVAICIKIDEFCIKNEIFVFKMMNFVLKMMNLIQTSRVYRLQEVV